MGDKLNSLMRFRFQRQPNPRLEAARAAKATNEVIPESPVITIEDTTPTHSPVAPDQTSQSQPSAESTQSPLAAKSQNLPETPLQPVRNNRPIILDSDEEDSTEVAGVANGNESSQEWLSKSRGIEDGGTAVTSYNKSKKNKQVISVCSSDEDELPTLEFMGSCQSQSSTMEPSQTTTEPQTPSPGHKRERQDSLNTDLSQLNGLPRKRIRMMSDSSESDMALTPVKTLVQSKLNMGQKNHTKATRANTTDKMLASVCLPDKILDDDEEEEHAEDSGDEAESHKQSKTVLSFFQNANLCELSAMPACTKKKAELIISLRPFRDYDNLVQQFTERKELGFKCINGCWDLIQIRQTVVKLMIKCENISERLDRVVGDLASQTALDNIKDVICEQPRYIADGLTLQPYQLIGLTWLRLIYKEEVDGILADEMGLGKTIQAIAFLAYLLQEGDVGPHVVVVPASVIENWARELEKWCPTLNVELYYGTPEERKSLRIKIVHEKKVDFHVLLTTYSLATGSVEDRSLFKKFPFHYAIFDEGHLLKNMRTQRYAHLSKIRAERRLLLTGTPLQNNLLELISLLSFVVPHIFCGKTEHLKKIFTMVSATDSARGQYERERIAHAKKIMRPFVLRRLKKEVLHQLPKKTEKIVACLMIPDQDELYTKIRDDLTREISFKASDVESYKPKSGLAALMKLRLIANHPLLYRNHYNDDVLTVISKTLAKEEPEHRQRGAIAEVIKEDMQVMSDFEINRTCLHHKKYLGEHALDPSFLDDSGKFRMLDNMLPKMKKEGDRVLLFSQFNMVLDIIQEYLRVKNHKFLRLDGSTPVSERLHMIDQYNEDPTIFIFLLTTRAGGLGINLATANKVIIHDIDYNPYNDKQAEDRSHRLGQTREVEVIKLISLGTVEEAMLECQQVKLKLEQDVTRKSNTDSEDQLEKEDVRNLLRQALSVQKDSNMMKNMSAISDSVEASTTPVDNDISNIFSNLDDLMAGNENEANTNNNNGVSVDICDNSAYPKSAKNMTTSSLFDNSVKNTDILKHGGCTSRDIVDLCDENDSKVDKLDKIADNCSDTSTVPAHNDENLPNNQQELPGDYKKHPLNHKQLLVNGQLPPENHVHHENHPNHQTHLNNHEKPVQNHQNVTKLNGIIHTTKSELVDLTNNADSTDDSSSLVCVSVKLPDKGLNKKQSSIIDIDESSNDTLAEIENLPDEVGFNSNDTLAGVESLPRDEQIEGRNFSLVGVNSTVDLT